MRVRVHHPPHGNGRALTSVTSPVTPGVTGVTESRWELPVWGPVEPVPALETAPALSDTDLEWIVTDIIATEATKGRSVSYREVATLFRGAGHSASEVRLRAAWKRVVAA